MIKSNGHRNLSRAVLATLFAASAFGQNGGGPPKPVPYTLSGAYTLSGRSDKSSAKIYSSDAKDVSAIYVKSGGDLTLTDPVVTTTGDTSSDDNSSAFGLNAAVLAGKGGKIKITGGSVTTSGAGANGLFAAGSSASISASKTKITTTGDGAHGVMASANGTLKIDTVEVSTTGAHAAAIATDRGGGSITVTGGNFNTSGDKSPAVYSTGTIRISGAVLIATGAEAVVVEGHNSVVLSDTKLTSQKSRGVMIYQSGTGDGQSGSTVNFAMKNGSLTVSEGPMFHVTNTTATVYTTGVTFNSSNGAATGPIISAAAGQWGKSGSNGGNLNFTADREILNGDVTADEISSITLKLTDRTTLTGTIKNAAVSLDSSSIWTVTAESTITALADSNMSGNGFTNIVGNGHNVHYDSTLSANQWLYGRTYNLASGGKLIPIRSNGNQNNIPGSDNNQNNNNQNNYGNRGGYGGGGGGGGGGRR
jgi:hypothetical protein